MYRKEYPIRCKSCNEQLACYSEEYESLSFEYGPEKALNMLNIMEPCSRYNMMNPVIILNIRENRNLIEGLRDIDVVDKFSEDRSFQTCEYHIGNIDYNKARKRKEVTSEANLATERSLPIMSITGRQQPQRSTYSAPLPKSTTPTRTTFNVASKVSSAKQVSKVSPAKQVSKISPAQQVSKINLPLVQPVQQLRGLDIEDEEIKPEKINKPEKEAEFQYPTTVGVPTINPSGENVKVHISGKYYAEVLSGRTYICR